MRFRKLQALSSVPHYAWNAIAQGPRLSNKTHLGLYTSVIVEKGRGCMVDGVGAAGNPYRAVVLEHKLGSSRVRLFVTLYTATKEQVVNVIVLYLLLSFTSFPRFMMANSSTALL